MIPAPRPGPSRRGRTGRKIGLLLLSTVASLALAEGALRWFSPYLPDAPVYVDECTGRESKHFIADPATGWRMRPEVLFHWTTEGRRIPYRADAEGYRVGEPSVPSRKGSGALVVAGDSFAFGTGVEFDETFAARVAAALGQELRNIAMPGFGLDQILLAVRRDALPKRPARLLVALYENDFERVHTAFRPQEGMTKPTFVLDRGALRRATAADRPTAWVRWCERRLLLAGAYRAVMRRVGMQSGRGAWWRLNAALLDALITECAVAEVPLAVVFVPSKRWRRLPALGALLRARGVAYLDPTEGQPSAPAGAYYEHDLHLTAEGHRLMAEWIAAWLQEE